MGTGDGQQVIICEICEIRGEKVALEGFYGTGTDCTIFSQTIYGVVTIPPSCHVKLGV
jgi:hypothetical protein